AESGQRNGGKGFRVFVQGKAKRLGELLARFIHEPEFGLKSGLNAANFGGELHVLMFFAESNGPIEGSTRVLDAAASQIAAGSLKEDKRLVETAETFFYDALLRRFVAVKIRKLEAHEAGGAR